MTGEKVEVDTEQDFLEQMKLFESLMLGMVEDPAELQRQFDQNHREVKEEFAPLNNLLDTALAQLSDPECVAAHIRKCHERYFPWIVTEQVEKLLCVNSRDDVSRVTNHLNQLKRDGVSAVWDVIKDDVTKHARRVCGTAFPDEEIDSGKNMHVDITRLENIVAEQVKQYDTRRATSASRDSSSRTAFSGFRRGFLSVNSSEPARKDAVFQNESGNFQPK